MIDTILLIGAFWLMGIGSYFLGYFHGQRFMELRWLESIEPQEDGAFAQLMRLHGEHPRQERVVETLH